MRPSLLPTGSTGTSYRFFSFQFKWREPSPFRAENKLAIAKRPVFDFAAMSFPAVSLADSALLKAVKRLVGG
jgi:hypothetical protein